MENDSQNPYQPHFQLSERRGKPDSAQPSQEELSPWNSSTVPIQTWSKSFGQFSSTVTRKQQQKWRKMVIILASIVGTVMLITGALLVFALPTSTPNAQTVLKTPLMATSTHVTPVISMHTTPVPTSKPTSVSTSNPTPAPTSTTLPISVNKPSPTVAPTPTHPATSTTRPTVTGDFTVSLNTQTSNANVSLNITIQNFANKQFFVNITDQANGAQVLHQIENTDGVGHNGANLVINGPPGVQTLPTSWVSSITDAQGNVLSTAPVIVNGTQGKATF